MLNRQSAAPSILVVSSRAELRQVIQVILEQTDYPTHVIGDVSAALQAVAAIHPSLVIVDNALGTAVCDQIKAVGGEAPMVLVVLDSLHPSVIDRFLDAGADDTIMHPIHARTLQNRVTHLLCRQTTEAENLQMESALTIMAERSRILLDAAPVAIYTKDRDGRYLTANKEDLTYYHAPGPIGSTDFDLFPAEMAAAFRAADLQVMKSGEALDFEEFVPTVRGSRVVLSRKVPLRDSKGEIEGVMGISLDITERKRAEEALRESNELFHALFEYSPDSVFLLDAVTNIIVDCNQVACQLNGYSREELIGQSIDIVNAYDQGGYNITHHSHDTYVELLRSKPLIQYETIHRRKDGTLFPIEVSTTLVTVAGRELILGIDRHITERKQAETALRLSEERYRLMADYATDMISRHSMDGVYLYASPACETLLGYKAEALVGRASYDFMHPTDRVQVLAHHDELLDEQEIFTDSYRIARKDGSYIWFETTSRKIRNPETGIVDEVICVSRDISDRKQMESAEREQHLRIQALGDASAILKNTLKTDEALDGILKQAARVVPHDAASIALIEGDTSRIVRCRGFKERGEEDYVLSLRFSITLDNPFYKQLIGERKPVIINDVQLDSTWVDSGWIRGNLSVPIILHDTVIGLLHLDSSTVGAFTFEQAQLLESFADQVAIAIQSAQLFDELQALYHATSFALASFSADNLAELGRQITQTVIKEFDKTDCALGLVDHSNGRITRLTHPIEFSHRKPIELYVDGPGLIPLAVRTGETFYVPDVSLDERYLMSDDRTRSEYVIPLRTRYEVIGVLDVQSQEENAFSEHDRRILLAFAERVSAAIENLQYAHDLERRVAQRTGEMLRVKEQVEAILNNNSDAIIVTAADGTIRRVNKAFSTHFGYEWVATNEDSLLNLVTPHDQSLLKETLRHSAAGKYPGRLEVVLRRADDSIFNADVAIAPIQEGGYETVELICSVRDITERKQMELELRNALEQERELSELKSRFVTTASHEFRTPLAMIMTSSELLEKYGTRMTMEQKFERLVRIQTEVKNMARLLDDVLTVNKSVEAVAFDFDPEPLNLLEFCRQVVDSAAASDDNQHSFDVLGEGNNELVNVDRKFMHDILMNLLSNSLKYSLPNTKIAVKLFCEAHRTVIQIQDHGIGIPEVDQKRLFEAFHRGENVGMVSGTGLGLTIAKQAVELHGGTITFESVLGVGTTFTVTIPNVVIEDRNYEH
ncbi:MAG: PAS domain S-box protein [Chloroflexota bacterium]